MFYHFGALNKLRMTNNLIFKFFISLLQEKLNSGFLKQAFPVEKLALDHQG